MTQEILNIFRVDTLHKQERSASNLCRALTVDLCVTLYVALQ